MKRTVIPFVLVIVVLALSSPSLPLGGPVPAPPVTATSTPPAVLLRAAPSGETSALPSHGRDSSGAGDTAASGTGFIASALSDGHLPEPIRGSSTSGGKWQMVFHDDFGDSKLDRDKWGTELRWGRTNSTELQYYSPDAFEFLEGTVRIKAEKRMVNGKAYSSGVISSFHSYSFTYGYAEIRAKVPAGAGLWPAFWLLARDPYSASEIDVMEFQGHDPGRLHMVLHSRAQDGGTDNLERNFAGPDFSRNFHTYSVKWDSSKVVWYVDGTERFRVTQNVPQEPMHLIVTLAVGGAWVGEPNSSTVFPAYLDVDYVRVFQEFRS